jgi:hypothetical protein
MVEPVDPFERGELDGFERPPGATSVDHFCLVKAIDRLGQSIVIAVANEARDSRVPAPSASRPSLSKYQRACRC